MEENAGSLVLAIHAAEVEIIDAAEVAREIEGAAVCPFQPARQRLQVELVLRMVSAFAHASSDILRRVSGQGVSLPVHQVILFVLAEHQVDEAGVKAFGTRYLRGGRTLALRKVEFQF